MFESVELINHESHKNTLMRFSPGLNVFIGPTDAGKSSAFRGIYWALFNSPNGDSMRPKYWEGDTKSIITFDDAEVTRMKGKALNHYQLNDNDPINAGAGAPPFEISEAIRMDDVNFQTQVDRSFLMFETPGERGRILNRVAGLDEIDKAIDNSSKDEKRLNREYKTEKARTGELETEMEGFVDLPDQEQRVIMLEQLGQLVTKSANRASLLFKLVGQVAEVDKKLDKAEELLPAEEGLESASQLVLQINEAQGRADTLNRLTLKIGRVERDLKEAEHLPAMEAGLEALLALPGRIAEHEDKANKLSRLARRLNNNDKRAESLTIEIKKLEDEMPENCPTCGAELENE